MKRRWCIGALALGLSLPAAWATAQGQPSEAKEGEEKAAAACEDIGTIIDFKVDSATLDAKAKKSLEGVASWLQEDEKRSVRIDGFTDQTGPTEYNEELSQRRAEAAQEFLAERGIEPSKVVAQGRGEGGNGPEVENRRAVEIHPCEKTEEVATAAEPPPAPVEPEPEPVTPPEPQPPPEQPPVVAVPPPAAVPQGPRSRIGVGVEFGGGVTNFSDPTARDFTDPGGSWTGRVTVGTRSFVALEGAYVGSAQRMETQGGFETNEDLIGHGVEGTVRLNGGTGRVQPYAFGGVGFTHYKVSQFGDLNTVVLETDDVGTFPVGGGIGFRASKALLLDLRGAYRWTWDNDLFITDTAATLDNWNVTGHIGWEF